MAKPPPSHTALCAAVAIDAGGAGNVPDWLHLLPAGSVRTNDGRGPYRAPADAAALIAASLKGGKLVLDENHATDLAAPKGGAAPARAWIVELQQRADGIWGRAEWTPTGRQLMEAGEYRGISPVIAHRRDGAITAILRASLTNTPNLQGLTALHSEEKTMDFRTLLIEALGLDGDADDAAIAAALKAKLGDAPDADTAMQSALAPIASALGLAASADAGAILTSLNARQSGENDTITALQSQVASLTTKVGALTENGSRERAVAFVDGAIADFKVGVKPLREDYITMHMANPAQAEKIVGALPSVRAGGLDPRDVVAKPGELSAADRQVVQLMGIDPAAYKAQLAADRGETQEMI